MCRLVVFTFIALATLASTKSFAGTEPKPTAKQLDALFDTLKLQERHRFRIAEMARVVGAGTEVELKAKLGDQADELIGVEPFKKAFRKFTEKTLSASDVTKTIEFYKSPAGARFAELWSHLPVLTGPFYEEREERIRARLSAVK